MSGVRDRMIAAKSRSGLSVINVPDWARLEYRKLILRYLTRQCGKWRGTRESAGARLWGGGGAQPQHMESSKSPEYSSGFFAVGSAGSRAFGVRQQPGPKRALPRSTPTGFCPPARACEARATPGWMPLRPSTPKELCQTTFVAMKSLFDEETSLGAANPPPITSLHRGLNTEY